jgi:predicted DCC family thiol-disulfide oxidoreductase YuxK
MQNTGTGIKRVVLYHRPGCHLCEEAEKVLAEAARVANFSFESINIESDLQLLEAYRLDIPVIEIDGKPKFRHRIGLDEILSAIRSK